MDIGKFYFLKDEYFIDFPDKNLVKNKELLDGQAHDRPCFYAYLDKKTQMYWMIPFSSKVEKYRNEYNKKVSRYGKCDTIVFGEVLGHTKAFLIQNMCPIIPKYIKNQYIDKVANIPVKINGELEKEIVLKAKRLLSLYRQGKRFIFPDILKIEEDLIKQLGQDSCFK